VNKTHHLVVGEITHQVPIDNSYFVQCHLYQKAGNDYKLMPYKLPKKACCDTLRDGVLFMPDIIKASDLPPQDTVKDLAVMNKMEVNQFNSSVRFLPELIILTAINWTLTKCNLQG